MSNESEHNSRHDEAGESMPNDKGHLVTGLFEGILKSIRDIHLSQESLTFPSIFLVYAHENSNLKEVAADAEGARDLIQWLYDSRFNIHSDRTHGYDPLNATPPDRVKADNEKILSSQLRLLPLEDRFDNVILCGSQVLGEYVSLPYFVNTYTECIQKAYWTAVGGSEPDKTTHVRICEKMGAAVKSQLENEGFHHVLTELAFLGLRAENLGNKSENHGIIPILLNGTAKCFPDFIQESDTIRIEPKHSSYPNQHLHKAFFKLLKRLLTQKQREIENYETYYERCVKRLQIGPAVLKEEEFLRFVKEEYLKVQQELKDSYDATIRDQQFLITLASTFKVPAKTLGNALDKYASDRCRFIRRVSGELLPMDRCYINLAVIEQEENKTQGKVNEEDKEEDNAENEDPQTLSEIFRRLSSIEATGANPHLLLPLQDLFKPRKLINGKTAVPKRILILGRAGVGKTTLSKKILYEYTYGRKWRDQFDMVLWVPLRKFKQKRFRSLIDVFVELYFQQEPRGQASAQTLLEQIQGPGKYRTLLILDGLDEIQGWKADDSMKSIVTSLLNHDSVIITSRPTGLDLRDIDLIDLRLETIGFNQENVWAYLEHGDIVASKQESANIKQWIKSNPFVQEVTNIPIQLDILCYSWDEIKQRQQTNGSFTITTLYQAMIYKLWRRDILHLELQDRGLVLTEEIFREIRLPWRMERVVQPEIDLLNALAFERFQAGQIEFNNSEIDHIIDQLETHSVQLPLTLESNLTKLSVLQINDHDTTGNQRSYSFLHLTFQEFYAAQWLVKQVPRNPSKVENCVRQHKYNPRYEIFWRFVAGLLSASGAVNSFFEWVNQEPQDLLGIQHQHLIMHLLNESGRHLDPKRRQALESQLNEWLKFEVTITGRSSLGSQVAFPEAQIFQLLEDESRLDSAIKTLFLRPVLSRGIIDRLVPLLKVNNSRVQYKAVGVLRRQTNLPKEANDGLMALLKDGNSRVQDLAAEALGRQTNLHKEAVDGLMALLKDSNSMVQDKAAEALGRQTNLHKEAVDGLMALLKDGNSMVQDKAAEALSGQTNLHKEAVDGLMALLKDGNSMVQDLAAEALSGQTNLPKEANDGLIALLKDGNSMVQDKAAEALSGQTNLHKEAVDGLVALLKDDDWEVQRKAAKVLGKQTNLHKEAVDGLVALLKDDHWEVQRKAVKVLGKQTNLPKEAINGLLALLKATYNMGVQDPATKALGQRKNPPKEVIDSLIALLEDGDLRVQDLATKVLGWQANLPKEAIDSLVALLKANDWETQRKAAEALGGQTNLPKEAIDCLVALLKNDHWEARNEAAEALDQQTNLPKEAIDGLVALLKANDWETQRKAAKVLGRRTNLPNEAIDDLVAMLKMGHWEARNEAAKALGQQTNLPKEATDGLVALLKKNRWDVQYHAAEALSVQTNLHKEAVDGLVALLKDDHWEVQRKAAKVLGKQKNLHKEAVDGLVALLKDDDWEVQRETAKVLGRQKNLPEEAVKNLIGLLDCIQEVAYLALNGQSTGQLYRLLPTLEDSLKILLYSRCLVERSLFERAPLYLEGNRLHFYTSSGLESVLLHDEAAFRQTILEAQKAAGIPSASWVKLVDSSRP